MQAMLSALPASQPSQLHFLGTQHLQSVGMDSWKYIQAISAGAVMFGAGTYIGNGPNFMVKSIAEQSHVLVPHFMEYIMYYSLPILGPVFIIIWLIFFQVTHIFSKVCLSRIIPL